MTSRIDNFPPEDRLQELFEATYSAFQLPVIVKDENFRFVYLNEAACSLLGCRIDDIVGRSHYEFLAKHEADRIIDLDREIFRTGVGRISEESIASHSDEARRVLAETYCARLPAPHSDRKLLITVIRDVTELGKAEENLSESEQHYRSLVELLPQTPWVASSAGQVEEIGATWKRILGRAPQEVLGSGWTKSVHPDDLPRVRELWNNSVSTGALFDVECRLSTIEGDYRWFRSRAAPKRDARGSITRWYGLVEDVDDKKKIEEALRESETRLRMITDSVPVMLWVSATNGESTYQNKTWLDFTGLDEASAMRLGWLHAVHPDDRDRVVGEFFAASEARKLLRSEYRLRRANGTWAWVIDIAQPRLSTDGELLGYSGAVLDISDRKDTELALERSEASIRSIFDSSPDCMRLLNFDGTPVQMNDAGREMFGISPDAKLDDLRLENIVSSGDRPKLSAALAFAKQGETARIEAGIRDRRGVERYMDVIAAPVPDPSGEHPRILTIWRDITEAKGARDRAQQAQASAEAALARLSTVLESTMDSVIVVDRMWKFTFINSKARALLKIGHAVVEGTLWDIFPRDTNGSFLAHFQDALRTHKETSFEDYLPLLNLWLEVHACPSDEGLSIFFRDISGRRRTEHERFQAQSELLHMSRHDALTGLPNRVYLGERLQEHLKHCTKNDSLAVLSLELNGFEAINATYGHSTGDDLLYQVAGRLRSCLKEQDTLARTGGDEFVIIQAKARAADDPVRLSQLIAQTFEHPFNLDETTVTIATSVGIAIAPEHGDTVNQLLRASDLALHRAKETGATHQLYADTMDNHLQGRQRIKADLRHALERGELEVFYQPIVELDSQRISSCEALVRWRHPEKGYISPVDFIPVAEESGLIVEIGAWVLQQACWQVSQWPASINVGVNLSPRQFKSGSDLLRTVSSTLASSKIDPTRVELEITESVMLDENDANLQTLRELKQLGVRIAMDDFGTGYSSLGYLRSFPFDKIKVDRRFISDLPHGKESLAIIRAVIGIGRALGIATLIEGVETEAQLDVVRKEGFHEAQGFLFAKPMRASEVADLLRGAEP